MSNSSKSNAHSNMSHCALGAIAVAVQRNDRLYRKSQEVLESFLSEKYPELRADGGRVRTAEWNDMLGRTAEEVREALLMAAKDLRNNGC